MSNLSGPAQLPLLVPPPREPPDLLPPPVPPEVDERETPRPPRVTVLLPDDVRTAVPSRGTVVVPPLTGCPIVREPPLL